MIGQRTDRPHTDHPMDLTLSPHWKLRQRASLGPCSLFPRRWESSEENHSHAVGRQSCLLILPTLTGLVETTSAWIPGRCPGWQGQEVPGVARLFRVAPHTGSPITHLQALGTWDDDRQRSYTPVQTHWQIGKYRPDKVNANLWVQSSGNSCFTTSVLMQDTGHSLQQYGKTRPIPTLWRYMLLFEVPQWLCVTASWPVSCIRSCPQPPLL